LKSREVRVQEGITLLKKLRELGVGDQATGLDELKTAIREWIAGGPAWSGKIDFPMYERIAEVMLPVRQGRTPTLHFRQYR
jgi:hypothetical protein